MIKSLTVIEKMIAISIIFTMGLLVTRIIYTRELTYGFYIWNTILALVPLYLSNKIVKLKNIRWSTGFIALLWLLFLPNAPYLITDIFHYKERSPIPLWFDLIIVISAAWYGLIIFIVSILQVETWLYTFKKYQWIKWWFSPISIGLCAYGVFIGRFHRFNSWDFAIKPHEIILNFLVQLRHPFRNCQVWFFTITFACFLYIFYYTINTFKTVVQTKSIQQ
ncbi:MAG: DUF1361 domain-containing protein [Chitinophagaceae bacterium]